MSTPSKWQPGQLLHIGFTGVEAPPRVLELVSQGRIGGVILFKRNLEGPRQVRALIKTLQSAAPDGVPLTVATDQEGGQVQRLRAPWTEWPPMRRLGRLDDPKRTAAFATALCTELADLGFNLTFAPVVDVDSNPDNPVIGDRSFGRDAGLVSRHAAAFVAAANEVGMASCAKHFPGHGDTATDSHLALPKVRYGLERLRRVELTPFQAAIEAGVPSIMSAHVLFPVLDRNRPATMSPEILGLLRDELGYEGLVFTDDLEMKAIADNYTIRDAVLSALEAGVDAPLVCHSLDVIEEVLQILERAPDRLLEVAIDRVLAFKESYPPSMPAAQGEAEPPPYPEHRALAEALTHEDESQDLDA